MAEFYTERFFDVHGRPWYRVIHVPTRLEAVAATADQAIEALMARIMGRTDEPRRQDPAGVAR